MFLHVPSPAAKTSGDAAALAPSRPFATAAPVELAPPAVARHDFFRIRVSAGAAAARGGGVAPGLPIQRMKSRKPTAPKEEEAEEKSAKQNESVRTEGVKTRAAKKAAEEEAKKTKPVKPVATQAPAKGTVGQETVKKPAAQEKPSGLAGKAEVDPPKAASGGPGGKKVVIAATLPKEPPAPEGKGVGKKEKKYYRHRRESSEPLTDPTDPQGGKVFEAITQPVRVLLPGGLAESQKLPGRDEIDEIIRKHPLLKPDASSAAPLSPAKLRKYSNVPLNEIAKKAGVELKGANQGGKSPADEDQRTEIPQVADYRYARPMQMLSHLSQVMRYAAETAGQKPVEVQFGYGVKPEKGSGNEKLGLYASTNNQESQKWLADALSDPGKHIITALKSDKPELQRVALKLLAHDEQQEARRAKIEQEDPNEREKLHKELDLSDDIRNLFLGGKTKVAKSDAPKGQERHAEQNITNRLLRNEYEWGEIAGTLIRCEACSGQVGCNLKDCNKDHYVIGKGYARQSSKAAHGQVMESVAEGTMRVATNQSRVPEADSPVALVEKMRRPTAEIETTPMKGGVGKPSGQRMNEATGKGPASASDPKPVAKQSAKAVKKEAPKQAPTARAVSDSDQEAPGQARKKKGGTQ